MARMKSPEALAKEKQLFKSEPPLYSDDVYCWLIKDGSMTAISTPHEGGGSCIFVNVEEATFIRDWLNKVLP